MKKYLFRNEGAWSLQGLNLFNMGLRAQDKFNEELYRSIEWAFDGQVEIVVEELANTQKTIRQITNKCLTISVDPCINANVYIGISRIFLPGGKVDLGISSRPGFPSLEEQVKTIPKGEYTLVEDDIFSGDTILQTIKLMEKHGISIKDLIVGMQVGRPKLDLIVRALQSFDPSEVIDLNDPRDFLMGLYGGGLVVIFEDDQKQSTKFRMPYILPFVDCSARSSIPISKSLEFSQRILEANIRFWEEFKYIRVCDTERFFWPIAQSYGISPQEPMHVFAKIILDLLDFPKSSIKTNAKNTILVDLNGTLLGNNDKFTAPKSVLRKTIKTAQENGWEIGLCSDSPAVPLIKLAKNLGMTGPIISENGMVVNEQPLYPNLSDLEDIKMFITNWANDNQVQIYSEPLTASELGGQKTKHTGIAFGNHRVCSISVFCLNNGKPCSQLTQKLTKALIMKFDQDKIDSSLEFGYIAYHPLGVLSQKGKALRAIGWELFLANCQLWMIGNSQSDLSIAPSLCQTAFVANHKVRYLFTVSKTASNSATYGVIELIKAITKGK